MCDRHNYADYIDSEQTVLVSCTYVCTYMHITKNTSAQLCVTTTYMFN